VGHHGGRGTTAAAMVHRVLLIDMCLVLDLCRYGTNIPYSIMGIKKIDTGMVAVGGAG
jgi:hypothetical protein